MTTDIPETSVPLPPAPPTLASLSSSDERTWAMLAHISALLNLIPPGFLGPIAAMVIYLIYKDRSRYVAYQALQAFIFQLIWWVGAGAILGLVWAVTGMLSAVLVGILLIPIACALTPVFGLMPVVAPFYGFWAAIETSQGKDFKYWLIGDWVRGTLTN
jgi:uncharacterized protein